MFFLLFSTRPTVTPVLTTHYACPFCGRDAPQRVYRRQTQFTVFFIPLFRFGSRHFVECSNCSGTTELSPQQVEHAIARTAQPGV